MDRRIWIVAECLLCLLLVYSAAFGAEPKKKVSDEVWEKAKTEKMVSVDILLVFYGSWEKEKKALAEAKKAVMKLLHGTKYKVRQKLDDSGPLMQLEVEPRVLGLLESSDLVEVVAYNNYKDGRKKVVDEVWEIAAKEGKVEVIVGLDVPENWDDKKDKETQKAIKAAQEAVLKHLGIIGGKSKHAKLLSVSSYGISMLLEVEPYALELLESSDDVSSVTYNRRIPFMPPH